MASGTFQATLLKTANNDTTIDAVYTANNVSSPAAPGNVGVCLSGGGSRAMSAGMGQLLALSMIQANGSSVLSQVKALSTVSGGSWLGTCYTYLNNASVTDEAFLGGPYVDPSQLTVSSIGSLPAGCIGGQVNSEFSIESLLFQALCIKIWYPNFPSNLLWQTLIARHILSSYGIYETDSNQIPTDSLSYNAATQAAIVAVNSGLAEETFHLVASGAPRVQRAFHICNFALLLTEPVYTSTFGELDGQLAPVQTSPFFTGVFGPPQPGAKDSNQVAPGGGGVTSFAFNSNSPLPGSGSAVSVSQRRQWSLADSTGSSSAAFAETINDLADLWKQDPGRAVTAFLDHHAELVGWAAKNLPHGAEYVLGLLEHAFFKAVGDLSAVERMIIQHFLSLLGDLVPQYSYWPVANPVNEPIADRFADGGSLDNSGINGLLAYNDIQSILVFTNTDTQMTQPSNCTSGQCGIHLNGQVVPGTNVSMDDSIPPLFGFQPYQGGVGYLPVDLSNPTTAFVNNQVFESCEFVPLLQGLWAASGSGGNSGPAVFQQTLTVQANSWFGIKGGQQVTVIWNYLNPVSAWASKLDPSVASILPSSFPSYNTFTMLELSPQEVNLLANLTAWCVLQNQAAVAKLFSN